MRPPKIKQSGFDVRPTDPKELKRYLENERNGNRRKAELAAQPELPGDWRATYPVLCKECYGLGTGKRGAKCANCKGKGVVPNANTSGLDEKRTGNR